jgi:hypothetical protein
VRPISAVAGTSAEEVAALGSELIVRARVVEDVANVDDVSPDDLGWFS